MTDKLRELIEELFEIRSRHSVDAQRIADEAATELTRLSEENERMREEIARLKKHPRLKIIPAPPVTFDED